MIHSTSLRKAIGARLSGFLVEDDAATAVEYAFMLAIMIIGAMAAIQALGSTNRDIWSNVGQAMQNVL